MKYLKILLCLANIVALPVYPMEKPEANAGSKFEAASFVVAQKAFNELLLSLAQGTFGNDEELCIKKLQLILIWPVNINIQLDSVTLDCSSKKIVNKLTMLHALLHQGFTRAAQLLMGIGAKFDIPDINGLTPLHVAAARGFNSTLVLLLAKGASLETRSIRNATIFHAAASSWGDKSTVRILFNAYEKKFGKSKAIEMLNASDMTGATALHYVLFGIGQNRDKFDASALQERADVFKELLSLGADPNIANEDNAIPLHIAAQEGLVDIVKILLDNGSSVNVQDTFGITPLHAATYIARRGAKIAAENRVEIIRLLLLHGADKAIRNNRSRTALEEAEIQKKANVEGSDDVLLAYENWLSNTWHNNMPAIQLITERLQNFIRVSSMIPVCPHLLFLHTK